MEKTIIYLRTSTEDQNPENQLKDCISINQWGDHELIEDKQSAWKDVQDRPGLEELKRKIRAREVKHLIIWDFDRLFRNRGLFKAYLEFLRAYKVELHSFNQKWMEDIHKIPEPFNEIMYEMLINLFGWLAEEESNKKSKRVKAAVRLKQGMAYSYKGNKWGRKTISTQKKNKIKEMRLNGFTISQISKDLNLSKGVVHKYLPGNSRQDPQSTDVQ